MARSDSLLRLHSKLKAKRDELRDTLSQEIELGQRPRDVGDIGDDALDDNEKELNSQLVAFESRELAQVERALAMIREGRYGDCDICHKKIPIARLNALPFTPLCVKCQEKLESSGQNPNEYDSDWEHAYEYEGRMNPSEITIADLDQ
jgi:DnaK suppressor protein